jgi:osmotically-inducible protein OsmY
MANRNQNDQYGSRQSGSRGGSDLGQWGGRSQDDDEGRYSESREREFSGYGSSGYGSSGNYGGSEERDRSNYGNENYSGYGNFGQGDYSQGDYGQRDSGSSGTSQYGRSSFGGTRNYSGSQGSGSQDWGSQGSGSQGWGSQGSGGRQMGWSEPYGEGQQYGSRGSQGLHRGKGPKGYQRSDERIKELISESLSDHPEIDASEITVNVQGGKLTLEGTVDSRQTKNTVEDIAEQFCQDVQNNLRVSRQGESQSSSAGRNQGSTGQGSMGQGSMGQGSTGKSGAGSDESDGTSKQKRN